MPEIREWTHRRLTSYEPLVPLIGDRVHQQGSILSAQITKPYLVHHFGNNTDEGMYDEDSLRPNRQFVQIFVHTAQGDYGPLDDLIPLVKDALVSLEGRPKSLIHVQYLETSQDLQDDLLQTYFRYIRLQYILAR